MAVPDNDNSKQVVDREDRHWVCRPLSAVHIGDAYMHDHPIPEHRTYQNIRQSLYVKTPKLPDHEGLAPDYRVEQVSWSHHASFKGHEVVLWEPDGARYSHVGWQPIAGCYVWVYCPIPKAWIEFVEEDGDV